MATLFNNESAYFRQGSETACFAPWLANFVKPKEEDWYIWRSSGRIATKPLYLRFHLLRLLSHRNLRKVISNADGDGANMQYECNWEWKQWNKTVESSSQENQCHTTPSRSINNTLLHKLTTSYSPMFIFMQEAQQSGYEEVPRMNFYKCIIQPTKGGLLWDD